MRREAQRNHYGNTGSMTVELVILAPVLTVFALVMIGVGRYELARQQTSAATMAAAEAASVGPANQAQALAAEAAESSVQYDSHTCIDLSVRTNITAPQLEQQGYVTVRVSCRVILSDLLVPGTPGSVLVHSVEVAPIDPYRATQ